MPKTFNHSGDVGDIIYALPTIKAMGGGILYVYPHWTTRITPQSVTNMAPLLEYQDYVYCLRYDQKEGEVNLDYWRHNYHNKMSIANMVLRTFAQDLNHSKTAWLCLDEAKHVEPVIIHRSPRYHNSGFPWSRVVRQYRGRIAMVGLEDEHRAFCRAFGEVPYYPTSNLMELAQVIAGATLFIGNQSSPYAIAEGLKQNTIQEVCQQCANCLFDRPNAGYGIDDTVFLPEIP